LVNREIDYRIELKADRCHSQPVPEALKRAIRRGYQHLCPTLHIQPKHLCISALKDADARAGVSSIRHWRIAGRFPGAEAEEGPRGIVWYIPESDLKDFQVRRRGRPSKKRPGAKKPGNGVK
jgi:hypothetical protein